MLSTYLFVSFLLASLFVLFGLERVMDNVFE